MSTPLYQSIDDPLGGVWDLVNRRRIRKDEPGWDIYQVYLSSGGVVLDADPIGQLADLATAKTARVADINTNWVSVNSSSGTCQAQPRCGSA